MAPRSTWSLSGADTHMAEPSSQHRSGPSALIRGSVAWHLAAAAVTLVRPHWWPWTLGAVLADHLLLTAAGLWPRSRLLCPNWTRLPPAAGGSGSGAIAITIDHGPHPAVPPRGPAPPEAHRARATVS